MQLTGKVALVTGSGTGIGEAIARRLAGAGATVMVHDRTGMQAIATSIQNDGGCAHWHQADLQNPEACVELVENTVTRCGGIDILVNNAATTTRSNLETTDSNTFDYVMAVNIRAPLLLIRAALPHFRKTGGGRVLNIGSTNAYCGQPDLLAYSISKGALMTLTRNLADAYGREGIRINQFNVGWVLTRNEYNLKRGEGLPENWPQHIDPNLAPSGRILSPEEIAYFALSFLNDEASLINGAVREL